MGSKVSYFLSRLITKIKGESFNIDPSIPISYFLRLLCYKTVYLVYGMIRMRTFKRCFISPTATIKCKSKIKHKQNFSVGKHCEIDALSLNGINLGKNVSVGYNTCMIASGSIRYIGPGITIGDNVGLGTNCFFGGGGGIRIGKDTIFGNFVSIHSENHNYNDLETPIRLQGVNHKGVIIGENCWIGAKVTILDGTKLGNGCIVAAGAVVRGEFPDNVVIGGVPAKILKYRDEA